MQSALDERFSGASLRIVQPLGKSQLEQQEIDDSLILKLGTKDDFEVAFALNEEHASSLRAALQQTQRDTDPPLVRRPN